MSGQVVKIGDKIITLVENAYGIVEPKGTILTVISLKDPKFPGDADFFTKTANPLYLESGSWYWKYECFDRGFIRKIDLEIFNELGD